MTAIFLIRHGETRWNRTRRIQGNLGVPLSPQGKKQVHRLALRLAREGVDVLYSSDLPRAMETARILEKVLGVRAEPCPLAREQDFGLWQGLGREEVQSKYREVIEAYARDPVGTRVPGGESFADVMRRAAEMVTTLSYRHPGQRVALVSHSGTIKAVLCTMLGLDPALRGKLEVANASLTVASWRQGQWRLELFNDTCHLEVAGHAGGKPEDLRGF